MMDNPGEPLTADEPVPEFTDEERAYLRTMLNERLTGSIELRSRGLIRDIARRVYEERDRENTVIEHGQFSHIFRHNLRVEIHSVLAQLEIERQESKDRMTALEYQNRFSVRYARVWKDIASFTIFCWVFVVLGAVSYGAFGQYLGIHPAAPWATALLTPVLLAALLSAVVAWRE